MSQALTNVLVTGATGFVGYALASRLVTEWPSGSVVTSVRRSGDMLPPGVLSISVGDLSAATDWNQALQGVKSVVHCAARVHMMREKRGDALSVYRQVNVNGTLKLAQQAAEAGVNRFVFLSSIKVNGETTQPGYAFTSDDVPAPSGPYATSKLEAEQGLKEISARTGMELVIIRPPLVYGPGVKANFASMLKWLSLGVPLPLGAVHNVRSMVAVDNLVDLLVTCLKHPAAAGQTFLVSDGEDVSITQLLQRVGQAMEKKAILVPVPAWVLELGSAALGKREVAQRLCGTLQVDIQKTRNLLGWAPPLTLDKGLKLAVEGIKR